MPYEVPLLYTAGNWLMSTACCLSCFHIPNWAEMTCVCAFPCLAALDDDSACAKADVPPRCGSNLSPFNPPALPR